MNEGAEQMATPKVAKRSGPCKAAALNVPVGVAEVDGVCEGLEVPVMVDEGLGVAVWLPVAVAEMV